MATAHQCRTEPLDEALGSPTHLWPRKGMGDGDPHRHTLGAPVVDSSPALGTLRPVIEPSPGEVQRRVDAHRFWYHTIDVAPGVATKGWFDLRPVVDLMPWPNVAGKRCLDIGTFDGFLAFELERRGAAEVVAIDVEDHLQWDWPPDYRSADLARDPGFSGPPKGAGFRLAKELMGSTVEWRPLSIYDLDPDEIGTFDVVVCGSLLLHLRDPSAPSRPSGG